MELIDILFDDKTRLKSEYLSLNSDNANTNKISQKLMGIFKENILSLDDMDLVNIGKGPGGIAEVLQRFSNLIKKSAHGNIAVNAEMIGTILEVVVELGKCKEYRTRAIKAERKAEAFQEIHKEYAAAWEEYNSEKHTRWDQRAKAFFNHMGMTNGKRQKKTNKKYMFYEYLDLAYGSVDIATLELKDPISKHEALKILATKYCLASPEACLEQLRVYVRETKNGIKENEKEELEGWKGLFVQLRLKGKKECDLSQEEKKAFDTKWNHCKEKLKKNNFLTSGFKGILPGKDPYK